MAASQSPEQLYPVVTSYLLHRQLPQAYTTLTQLLSRIAPPYNSSLTPWSADLADEGVLGIWSNISDSTIQALKLGVTVHVAIYSAVQQGEELEFPEDVKAEVEKWTSSATELYHRLLLMTIHKLVEIEKEDPKYQAFLDLPSRWIALFPPSLISTLLLGTIKLESELSPSSASGGNERPSDILLEMRKIMDAWIRSLPDQVISTLRQLKREHVTAERGDRKLSQGSREPTPESDIHMDESIISLPRKTSPPYSPSSSSSHPTSTSEPHLTHLPHYIRLLELYTLRFLPLMDEHDTALTFIREDGLLGARRKEHWIKSVAQDRSERSERKEKARAKKEKGHGGQGKDGSGKDLWQSTSPRGTSSRASETTIRRKQKERSRVPDMESSAEWEKVESESASQAGTERTIRPMGKMTGAGTGSGRSGGRAMSGEKEVFPEDSVTEAETTAEEEEEKQSTVRIKRTDDVRNPQEGPIGNLSSPGARIPTQDGTDPMAGAGSGQSRKTFASLIGRLNAFLDRDIESLPLPTSSTVSRAINKPLTSIGHLLASWRRQIGLEYAVAAGILAMALTVLAMRRALRRRSRLMGLELAEGANPLLKGLFALRMDPRKLFWVLWRKIRDVIVMGTTITYV